MHSIVVQSYLLWNKLFSNAKVGNSTMNLHLGKKCFNMTCNWNRGHYKLKGLNQTYSNNVAGEKKFNKQKIFYGSRRKIRENCVGSLIDS